MRPAFLGWEGLATALLSLLVMAMSGGVTLMLAAWRVRQVARAAPNSGLATRAVVLGHRDMAQFRPRLRRAAGLGCELVLLGGVTRPGLPSEAAAGRAFLVAEGVPAARIAIEEASRHTLENLRAYRATFAPGAMPDLLVTSRAHLARSLAIAGGLGLRFIPCAAEADRRLGLAPLWREAALLHWYEVGARFARLTRNRAMLARIT